LTKSIVFIICLVETERNIDKKKKRRKRGREKRKREKRKKVLSIE